MCTVVINTMQKFSEENNDKESGLTSFSDERGGEA
jgi:hypothetical protein